MASVSNKAPRYTFQSCLSSVYASIVWFRFKATRTPFQSQNRCHHNQSHFSYLPTYRKQLWRVKSKHSRSTLQVKNIEVHTIGMEVQQRSVRRKGELGRKVNRSSRPYDTYNRSPHQSKTDGKRVQRRVQDVKTPERTPTTVGRNPTYASDSRILYAELS